MLSSQARMLFPAGWTLPKGGKEVLSRNDGDLKNNAPCALGAFRGLKRCYLVATGPPVALVSSYQEALLPFSISSRTRAPPFCPPFLPIS